MSVVSIIAAVAAAAAAIGLVVLFVAALISVLTNRKLATGGKVVWVLLVLAFPVLGAALWFLWGRDGQFTKTAQF